ncbi:MULTISPECIES: helix-turn-helix domain-containing protein [Fluoribacter]|uniref:helix-turn-helix domain-containing protein n=1 Tax=Fluoribacter TaxID=461 RepID=UPI0013EF8F74|nr:MULTISPECIES: helix-turn-helix domain-containing protein [Fluoribacter]MCW8419940.1 helix-turn-helix domain-containing protein [Fluoribacter dumoffii]
MQARKIIAAALNVSESAIKAWELGLRNPRPKYIAAIEIITEGKVNLSEIKKNKG